MPNTPNGLPIPSGEKQTCITGPGSVFSSSTCPVVTWGDITYWAYSFIDNRNAMQIVAYDSSGHIAGQWYKPGDRYVWQITVDQSGATITFYGQALRSATWAELYVRAADTTGPGAQPHGNRPRGDRTSGAARLHGQRDGEVADGVRTCDQTSAPPSRWAPPGELLRDDSAATPNGSFTLTVQNPRRPR